MVDQIVEETIERVGRMPARDIRDGASFKVGPYLVLWRGDPLQEVEGQGQVAIRLGGRRDGPGPGIPVVMTMVTTFDARL